MSVNVDENNSLRRFALRIPALGVSSSAVDLMGAINRVHRGVWRRLKALVRGPSSFEGDRLPELRGQPIPFGPVRILSAQPPVFLSGIPYDEFLGFAPTFARHYGNADAGFVIFPTWSIETPEKAKAIRAAVRRHTRRYDRHKFRYICNTPGEAELLNRFGQKALFLNHKFTVSEQIFRPLPGASAEFSAIYNARFVPGKRHELTAEIDSVAYVAYAEPQESRRREFQQLWPETARRSPNHVLLNPMEDGLPVPFSHQQVNEALNRAATGLILSDVEGASYAAMEYMLAGLPVVSTPSLGGRDSYFDPDYCAVVAPDPRSVREAVAALEARNIPRDYIREQTLKRIEPGRRQLLALADELIEELGGTRRFAPDIWPFGDISGVPWDGFKHHITRFEKDSATELERETGLQAGALAEVQLSAGELRPIVQSIQTRPGGSLLVFGCGNDSPLWEQFNIGGVTAFIEDDAAWAATMQAQLRAATIHLVHYGTRRSEWRKLLRQTSTLAMTLPQEIRSRQWDVILIDGPAGYEDDMPGRMKSIFEASRLVAPGGIVFVHDCERPVEAVYAARYLRLGRLCVEVKGRALLRGYQF